MTQEPDASPAPGAAPAPGSDASAMVLPRPNPGPEFWSESPRGWTPVGLAVAAILIAACSILAIRKWRISRRLQFGLIHSNLDPGGPTEGDSPDLRLIDSSRAVRAALIASFGPAWGSRTTEEVARDSKLIARLGPEATTALVTYLQRVDRAKFAGDEADDADRWIDAAHEILTALARRPQGRRGP